MASTFEQYRSLIKFSSENTMNFDALSPRQKIQQIKIEFLTVVNQIFDNPQLLKTLVTENKISNKESKILLKSIDKLNKLECGCCRQFDKSKVNFSPIPQELEVFLDMAVVNAKNKSY